jgi:cell division protein ZapA
MNEKLEKHIKVNILGRDYSIKSDEEEGYIYQVADYVNQKIGEMKDKGTSNPINTLIFAAFNIADGYLKMKRKQEAFISRIESKITEFDKMSKEK